MKRGQRRNRGGALKQITSMVTDAGAGLLLGGILLLAILYLAGFRPYVVWSGSMEPAVSTGSIAFVRQVPFEEIKNGEIIGYTSLLGQKIIHRVITVTSQGLETKGDANQTTDGITTTEENLLGRLAFSVPLVGYVCGFFQSAQGMGVAAGLLGVLLLCGIAGKGAGRKAEIK